jgi:tripartite-type tricarboxylate transporter receptor subunit TctC
MRAIRLRKEWLRAVVAAAALSGLSAGVCAQQYPMKPVRLVVGFTAGASIDIVARAVAQRMSESLGQQVVVDNRPGAGSNIGSEMVAKSAPDGYTMLIVNNALAISHTLYPKLGYDALRDLAPIAQVSAMPHLLAVHPSLPAKNARELVALAKSKPGALTFASSGVGVSDHIAGELFKYMNKINMVHIPYKGGPQAATDVASGQVDMWFGGLPSTLPFVNSGKLRALAVTSLQRSATLPNVPTVDESGVPGYEVILWYGTFVPAATPKDIVQRLNTEVDKALTQPEIRERFATLGLTAVGGPPERFAKFFRSEIEKWGKVIKAAGLKAE